MSQKDVTEKILEAHNDVFADIVNVLLFNGRQVIEADELEEQAPRSAYKADGRVREIERDVAKRWKRENIRLACVGFENQTGADCDMPLRVIGYDGAEYRAQLLAQAGARSRYPVVTLVLYFGWKKHWDQPTSLLERLDVPKDFRPFVHDYKINLFEIAFLTREQVELFRSDFRVVADYFVQKQESGDYIPGSTQIRHVQETLQLLSVMSGDHRFEDALNEEEGNKGKGGIHNMCDVLDRIEDRGLQKGLQQGLQKGIQQGENALAKLMKILFDQGRLEDARRAAEDTEYRHTLMKELSIFRK